MASGGCALVCVCLSIFQIKFNYQALSDVYIYFSNEIFIVNTNFITHFVVLIIGTHFAQCCWWLIVVVVVYIIVVVCCSLLAFCNFCAISPTTFRRWFLPFCLSSVVAIVLLCMFRVLSLSLSFSLNVQNIISNEFLYANAVFCHCVCVCLCWWHSKIH